MTKPIDFDRLALREIRKARLWYARHRADLPTRFMAAFRTAAARVEKTPQACSPHLFGTRIAPLRKFPYWIIFVEEPHRILVVSLMHSSRRPGYWRRRLPRL